MSRLVVSPDQRQSVVARKLQACLDAGMPVGWLFVPERRSVVVYSAGYAPRELTSDQALTLDQALPGWSVSVRQLYDAVWPVG